MTARRVVEGRTLGQRRFPRVPIDPLARIERLMGRTFMPWQRAIYEQLNP